MTFLIFVGLCVVIWLLWNICRNTNDALDKQTAIQYEIVSLEKRIEELMDKLADGNESKKTESPAQASGSPDALVNINKGTLKELMTLPKVGKGLGQKIIDARPYSTSEDLTKVQGISAEMFGSLKSLVSV